MMIRSQDKIGRGQPGNPDMSGANVRDDFPQAVLDVLAKRVGVRCSSPSCRKLTIGPRSESARIVCTGAAICRIFRSSGF
jgi:hypothetical protein